MRHGCGVFDVSHMGEVSVTGADAEKFVNHIFTNDVTDAPVGKCFYGMMLNPAGGVVDDLLVYKRDDDDFFLVINASNIDKDVAWIRSCAEGYDVMVDNMSDCFGELAVQGPLSEEVLTGVLGLDCAELTFYTFKPLDICLLYTSGKCRHASGVCLLMALHCRHDRDIRTSGGNEFTRLVVAFVLLPLTEDVAQHFLRKH